MIVAHEQPNRGPMTRAEYEALVRRGALEDARVELLYGRLVSMSPQGEPHTYCVTQLMTLLVRALGDRARVRVQAPFAAPDESEPEPDVAVVAPGDYLDGHPRVALLIVEVAETSLARDRGKARLYATAGVAEYWIVNLLEQAIEVHRQPGAEGYTTISRHGRGEKLPLAAFGDVALGVDEVLPPRRP
jgi:Uma2 family endonuclease